MFRNKYVYLIAGAVAVLILAVAVALFVGKRFSRNVTSQLLYYDYRTGSSRVLDLDTNETRLVAEGLRPVSWSPSGEKLLLTGLFVDTTGLWVSDYDGANLQQVLAPDDYPESL